MRFFERQEVKDTLSYLRAARNPKSRIDFERAAGAPTRGIGKTTLEKIFAGNESALAPAAHAKIASFRALLSRVKGHIDSHKASDAVRFVISESGLEKTFAESKDEVDRLGNIFELVAHAGRYDSLPAPEGIERLLEDASLMSDQDELEEKKEAVSLMTIHASKGLEFDAVFITGLEQGLFPSERESDGERDPEEERRLMYVALTRARRHLYLTLAASRLRYGSREFSSPSIFLSDIDTRLITYADGTPTFERIIR
jgi:DNA helicase-2/ATP-dependent DNA helicase PcrA